MSITKELRELQEHWKDFIGEGGQIVIAAIADRIDAEYQKAEDELKAKGGQSWLHGYEECHLELMEGNETIAASLEEAGWYRVLDADKQLIHIGDRMEHIELGYVLEVIAVGVNCFIAWNTHANCYGQFDSKLFRHHHEPTVEDVLREFAGTLASAENNWGSDVNDAIAEYASKLQLKEPSE